MPETAIILLLSAIVGLLVGSFLATLVLRLPRQLPVVMDRSACPHCGHRLGPSELIPVVSWLVQRRRCRACSRPISAFYPLMEISSAIVALAAFWSLSWPVAVPVTVGGWSMQTLAAWAIRKWLFRADMPTDLARDG